MGGKVGTEHRSCSKSRCIGSVRTSKFKMQFCFVPTQEAVCLRNTANLLRWMRPSLAVFQKVIHGLLIGSDRHHPTY
jgi:hypothetical protein